VRDVRLSEANEDFLYILDGPTFDELLKTLNLSVAKRNETWEEQSVPVSVYPLCYAV
jgi:hypothetical protein